MAEAPMPGNLPGQLTSFVGRTAELDEAAELLAGCRLLTIAGGGGSGKTRFAVQLAASSAAAFPDGSWFCDLAAVADPAGVADSAARALRLVLDAGGDPVRAVAEALRGKRACSSSTTASTSSRPRRGLSRISSSPAPACGCWQPARSPSASRGRSCFGSGPSSTRRR